MFAKVISRQQKSTLAGKDLKHKIVIIPLSISLKMCLGCSKELSHWDGSFEYPQHMFWLILVTHCYLVAKNVHNQPAHLWINCSLLWMHSRWLSEWQFFSFRDLYNFIMLNGHPKLIFGFSYWVHIVCNTSYPRTYTDEWSRQQKMWLAGKRQTLDFQTNRLGQTA